MVEFFQGASENVIFVVFSVIGFISLVIGYKMGGFMAGSRHSQERKELEKDSHGLQKSLKRLWEEDKEKLESQVSSLTSQNKQLTNKLEDYRKKLSGMGVLSFSGSKKRADILYSLLLENEALEQMITNQTQSMITDKQTHLNDRLLDIRKRQRLMAELFNDDTIKNYVKEVLDDETKMEIAADKVDHMSSTDLLETKEGSPTESTPSPASEKTVEEG